MRTIFNSKNSFELCEVFVKDNRLTFFGCSILRGKKTKIISVHFLRWFYFSFLFFLCVFVDEFRGHTLGKRSKFASNEGLKCQPYLSVYYNIIIHIVGLRTINILLEHASKQQKGVPRSRWPFNYPSAMLSARRSARVEISGRRLGRA